MRKSLLLLAAAAVVGLPAQAQRTDCLASYPDTAGPIPDEVLLNCAPPMVTVQASAPTDRAGAIHNNGAGNTRVVTFIHNAAQTLTVVAPTAHPPSATAFVNSADFAGNDLSTLYYVSNENHFMSANMTTGAITTRPNVTPAVSGGATGMSWDYTTSQMWLINSTGSLFILDLTTGVAVPGPTMTPAPGLAIDLAFHPQTGDMYVHDIGTDTIVRVNKVTGAATTVGPTGLAANFGQGMDFDNQDNTLYLYAVNTNEGNTTSVYSVNITTGLATLVSPIGTALTQIGDAGSMTQRGGVNPANEDDPENAAAFLGRVGPNPATMSANVAFSVREATDVRLALYDVLGREVAVLVDGQMAAGPHAATVDVAGLAPGTYALRLEAAGALQVRTLTVTR